MDKPPIPTTDYAHGQMMGMLVIIQMLEMADDANVPVQGARLGKLKRLAMEDLAGFFQKPEEDIILLVNNELRNI